MAKRKGVPKQKHVPLRTCVVCRETKPKRELVRVVLVPERGLVIDETGKLNGRGAYLCRKHACWEQALKRGVLARALRTAVSREDAAVLETYADSLAELEKTVQDSAEQIGAEETDDTN